MMTFKEYFLKESHTSKFFDEMIQVAKDHGCRVEENGVKFKVYASAELVKKLNLPRARNSDWRPCHKADEGAHPLRKWLKNVLKIKDSRLHG